MPFHCGDLFAKAESTRQPYNPARSKLEIKPHTQLDFTLRQRRSERQRSARRNCASVREQPPPTSAGSPKRGLTSLFTLAKLVRLAILNPSAVNRMVALSLMRCDQLKRISKSM